MLVNNDENLFAFVWAVLDLSGSYSSMLVNSDLSPANSVLSLLPVQESRAFFLSWHICLSISLYLRSYHNLMDQSYPHTAHAHESLHNYYVRIYVVYML